MASFNESIRQFNTSYYRFALKVNLWVSWSSYQNKRFRESYFTALIKYKKERKSSTRILIEILKLTWLYKCLPYHYFRYGLYRRQFDFLAVRKFYPETLFYYKVLPRINTNYVLLDDKNIFESILKGSSLKYPETILKKKNGCIYSGLDKQIVTDKELQESLNSTNESVLFCKPAGYSSGGKGILLIKKVAGRWLLNQKIEFDVDVILSKMVGDLILQRPVKNCREIAAIHDKSANSFRVLTVFKPGYGSEVIYVSLKLGTGDAITDNAHTGGIYIGVNHQTGQLHGIGFDENLNEYKYHPTSKVIFKDIKIERIETVIDCANKAANMFSDLMVVGWDIVLTDDDAYLLEGNSSSGLTIFQRPFNGLDSLMQVINPFLNNKH